MERQSSLSQELFWDYHSGKDCLCHYTTLSVSGPRRYKALILGNALVYQEDDLFFSIDMKHCFSFFSAQGWTICTLFDSALLYIDRSFPKSIGIIPSRTLTSIHVPSRRQLICRDHQDRCPERLSRFGSWTFDTLASSA